MVNPASRQNLDTTHKENSLSHDELMKFYDIAINEYRFQVNLNWQRSQYYLVFNTAILAVATGLVRFSDGLAGILNAALFGFGSACCFLCLAASRSQQEYYRAARNHVSEIEERLGIGSLRLATTPRMAGIARRFGKVKTFNQILLTLIGVVDFLGMLVIGMSTITVPSSSPDHHYELVAASLLYVTTHCD